MNPIAAAAEQTLREHPHPALTLGELVQLLARIDRNLDGARLRTILEQYPDRFRVLDPWRGAWAAQGEGDAAARLDIWVVIIEGPSAAPADAPPAALRLRESVRWLARGLDPQSTADVSRWYALARSEREVRAALLKRAA